ncbi:MAG TPA: TetR/AcrR family transcriptional regulator [Verrucomicrobiae bacterium]|nr:TetR/AcrR family transcriptional regulator [Verrucomicrobiae bacterium]
MTVVISRRKRKKTAIRAQILTTAMKLFSRHGLDAVTVDQIAEAADVGKGTIYNYFKTKEDVVVAFMADIESRVQSKLGRLVASAGPLELILAQFIEFQFRLKKQYHQFVRVVLGQMFVHTEHFLPYMIEMQKVIDPQLEALLLRLQKRGLVRGDIDLSQLMLVFKTMHLGLTALWAIEGPPFRQTTETLRQEMKFFCEGIGTKS